MSKTIKADPSYRNKMIVILVVASVSMALLDYYGFLRIGRYIEGLEGEELITRLRIVFICITLPVSIIGIHSTWTGYRVIKSNESPPPGTKVLVETKVATGKLVAVRGWLSFIFGLVAVSSPVLALLWLPIELGGLSVIK